LLRIILKLVIFKLTLQQDLNKILKMAS